MNLSPVEIGVWMIALFFVLMYLKMPVGVALLIPGFLGFWLIRGYACLRVPASELSAVRAGAKRDLCY